MQHIAVERRCFVLSCNQYATRADYPDDYTSVFGDAPDEVVTTGGRCIVDPLGNILAGPHYDGEAILTVEIDPSITIKGKFDLEVAGHYSRSELFEFSPPDREEPSDPEVD